MRKRKTKRMRRTRKEKRRRNTRRERRARNLRRTRRLHIPASRMSTAAMSALMSLFFQGNVPPPNTISLPIHNVANPDPVSGSF
jgi:hypothetical protein